jgi:hypothetical protein
MGTPHRGSSLSLLDFAKHLPWSDRVALLASEDVDELSFYKLNENPVTGKQKVAHAKLKRRIQKRKHELVELSYHFLKLFHASKGKSTSGTPATVGEFIIRNFTESASVARVTRVVRPRDANMRYPGDGYEWFKTEALDNVTHATMCKFSSAEDGNYLKVAQALMDMTDYGPIKSLGVCLPRPPMSNPEAIEWLVRARYAAAQAQKAYAPSMSAVSGAVIRPMSPTNTQLPAHTRNVGSPYNRPIALRPTQSNVNASTSAASSQCARSRTDSASYVSPRQPESENAATEDEEREDEESEHESSEHEASEDESSEDEA